MYVGRDFPVANQVENYVYGLDFVNDIPPLDSIATATTYLTVFSGVDATPSSHLVGSPQVNATVVSQRISGLLAGVTYILQAVAVTADGDTFSLYSRIACEDIYS